MNFFFSFGDVVTFWETHPYVFSSSFGDVVTFWEFSKNLKISRTKTRNQVEDTSIEQDLFVDAEKAKSIGSDTGPQLGIWAHSIDSNTGTHVTN